jgi:DNA-binding beta-propeller fold protein YncE
MHFSNSYASRITPGNGKSRLWKTLAIVFLLVFCALLVAQQPRRLTPGELTEGLYQLPNGWRLRPAGKQVALDTMPMASVTSPDGKFLVILCAGYNPPSLIVLEQDTLREVGRTSIPDGWLGLAMHPNGDRVFVGGGAEAAVFEFRFDAGALSLARRMNLTDPARRVADDFVGDIALSPDGELLYAARLYRDGVDVVDLRSGQVTTRFGTGRRPYRILPHPDGNFIYISSWADGSVYRHRTGTGALLDRTPVGAHATDMLFVPGQVLAEPENEDDEPQPLPFVGRIFVTGGNTNSAFALGVLGNGELSLHESINLSLTPRQPVGMTPSALAYDAERQQLYVVCSDANAVGVVNVRGARSRVMGFVPVGWYPVAAHVLPDGSLMAMNARGNRSFPNPGGPKPTMQRPADSPPVQTVGRLQVGTASVVPAPDDEQLLTYTRMVLALAPYRDDLMVNARVPPGNPIPNRPGDPSPIKHVIFVVNGSHTYDQILGDVPEGNGDPGLVLFGDEVTPNRHKLAREFVLLDNFYVNADVSADGLSWSSAAIAPDYVQRMWPGDYGGRQRKSDYQGGEPAALPPGGYLWTNATLAGITLRNYGWWTDNHPVAQQDGTQIAGVRDPVLKDVTSPYYRGEDLDFPDVERVQAFIRELEGFERNGNLPQLILMRLGNDRTHGLDAGRLTPTAMVADNDHALGLLVEAVSKSRFWKETAIFVLPTDAQNGSDHVDSHRAPAFVISPYTAPNSVDSNFYNSTSMLRTMELIVGLRPMTQFDAGASPMWTVFRNQPKLRPYRAEAPRVDLSTRNP